MADEKSHMTDGLLAKAAERATGRPGLFAQVLARYLKLNRLDEAGLCEQLECDMTTLNRLRLCARPDPEPPAFGLDLHTIADKLNLDAGALARIVREVDASDAFVVSAENRGALPFTSTPGMLKAARDHAPDEQPPSEEDELPEPENGGPE